MHLQTWGRNVDRGFGRELLTRDAFGHEILTCSMQQNQRSKTRCRSLATIVDVNQMLTGMSEQGVRAAS